MFTLRLFHQNEPFLQIEARELRDGSLSVGRDEQAGWPIADESRTLSRLHCTFAVEGGRLTLRDTSANGVLIGAERTPVEPDHPTPHKSGETVRLGDYMILVEKSVAEVHTIARPPAAAPERTAQPPVVDASLMEAFCAGAGLDASSLSEEEPAQVMRRLGEVYRRMVMGLGELMTERTLTKTEYQLERTTIGGQGNNPFRWAPPERVAVDLLRPRVDGFLSGPAAVQRSFTDINEHLLCTVAGAHAAVDAALEALDPPVLLDAAKKRGFSLKGQSAEAWDQFVSAYAQVRGQQDDSEGSLADRAFRDAYDAQRRALERTRTQP
jgi:predicted component of type VI protein secretion system